MFSVEQVYNSDHMMQHKKKFFLFLWGGSDSYCTLILFLSVEALLFSILSRFGMVV
jgi:hypothetical protein